MVWPNDKVAEIPDLGSMEAEVWVLEVDAGGLTVGQAATVLVEGRPVGSPRSASRPPGIGYAGAEPFLLHASVEDNLRYGNPRASREDVERAAALAEADAFIAALPDGYATIIGGRGLALSDAVCSADARRCWAVSALDGGIWKTDDGGENWTDAGPVPLWATQVWVGSGGKNVWAVGAGGKVTVMGDKQDGHLVFPNLQPRGHAHHARLQPSYRLANQMAQ